MLLYYGILTWKWLLPINNYNCYSYIDCISFPRSSNSSSHRITISSDDITNSTCWSKQKQAYKAIKRMFSVAFVNNSILFPSDKRNHLGTLLFRSVYKMYRNTSPPFIGFGENLLRKMLSTYPVCFFFVARL